MATIAQGRDVLTLVNVFTIKPEEPMLCEVVESIDVNR
jgi:hypothetical protein